MNANSEKGVNFGVILPDLIKDIIVINRLHQTQFPLTFWNILNIVFLVFDFFPWVHWSWARGKDN